MSALGDVTHVLPLVRTLERSLPDAAITWIVGAAERRLLAALTGVELIEYDKRDGFAGMLALRQGALRRRFDVLLHLQVAARANLLAACVRAERRIGYDRARSKDLHGLVVRERIAAGRRMHVLDAMGSFCEPLGLRQDRVEWNFPIGAAAQDWARAQWPVDDTPTLMISPCSSHAYRNWRHERYAALADHAAGKGWRIVFCGGRSALERDMTDAIKASMREADRTIDLVGRDSLEQLPALLSRASLLVSPDAGPMHIANAVGVTVLGLHAATNPARSGPYSDTRFCVDRYDDAARRYKGKPASALRWGTRIEQEGVMDLVTVADAISAFERYVGEGRGR